MEKYDRKTALRVLQDLSHQMYPNLDLFGRPTLVINRKDFEPIRKKWLDDPTTKNAVVLTEKEADLLAGELGVISPSSGMPLGQAFKEKICKERAREILKMAEDYNRGYLSNFDAFIEALKEKYGLESETEEKAKVEAEEEEELKSRTMAMEGPNKFASVEYAPTCRHGCDDCIHDPAYIKATYPEWYAELYGPKTPKEAAQDSRGCAMCKEGELYDDEDK